MLIRTIDCDAMGDEHFDPTSRYDHNVGTHQVKYTVDVLLRYGMVLDEEETCNWNSLAGHMAS